MSLRFDANREIVIGKELPWHQHQQDKGAYCPTEEEIRQARIELHRSRVDNPENGRAHRHMLERLEQND